MPNVGSLDRGIRLVIGAVLLAAPFLPPFASFFAAWGAWKFALVAVGIVMLATAALRFCPLYTLIGIRTCPVSKS
jgi:hypothetical protein